MTPEKQRSVRMTSTIMKQVRGLVDDAVDGKIFAVGALNLCETRLREALILTFIERCFASTGKDPFAVLGMIHEKYLKDINLAADAIREKSEEANWKGHSEAGAGATVS